MIENVYRIYNINIVYFLAQISVTAMYNIMHGYDDYIIALLFVYKQSSRAEQSRAEYNTIDSIIGIL